MGLEVVDKRLLMPRKLSVIDKLVSTNVDSLVRGKRLYVARMEVKRVMSCREWVADSAILLHIRTKLEILSREKVLDDSFRHGKFHVAYERGLVSSDGDKLIYIEYTERSQSMELEPIDQDQCIFIKNI